VEVKYPVQDRFQKGNSGVDIKVKGLDQGSITMVT